MECFYFTEVKILQEEAHLPICGTLEFILKNKTLIFHSKSTKEITNITSFHGDKDLHFISYRIFQIQSWLVVHLVTINNLKSSWRFQKLNVTICKNSYQVLAFLVKSELSLRMVNANTVIKMNTSFKTTKTTLYQNAKDVLKDSSEAKVKNAWLVLVATSGLKRDLVNDAKRIIFVLLELVLNSLLKLMEEMLFQRTIISSLRLWKQEKKKVMIQLQLSQFSQEFS